MGNIAKFLADNALKSIKESVRVANDMLQSFSLDDMGKAIDEAHDRITNEVKRFVGQIKNFNDRYSVDVPFNPNSEIISYSIDGNTLFITVKSKDGSSNSNKVVELPQDINPQEMTHSYDSEKHIMSFKFKKL